MKVTPVTIARSLVDLLESSPPEKHAACCDASLQLLRQHNFSRHLRSFPKLVANLIDQRHPTIHVSVTLPDSNEEIRSSLEHSLADVLGKNASIVTGTDETLIGGAVLRIDDDQYDGSVRGALSRLKMHLTSPIDLSRSPSQS